jgi:DNA recombination protein RmuC
VEQLVGPVAESLDRLAARVVEAERAQATTQAELRTELGERSRQLWLAAEAVRTETGRLAGALGRSEVRGAWGEAQLRRLVEAAGMLDRVHFVEQDSRRGDDGLQRPDLVVHLGDGRDIVVDAKVSLHDFLEAEAATEPDARDGALRRHAAVVSAHVDRLAAKEYWRQWETAPEFVVLFLPAESLLGATLAVDPALLDRAFRRRVVIATPTTLLALLGTVAHVWRQESVARNAREVHALGRELHDRLATMAGHLGRVGGSLDAAVGHYNRLVASLEGRVLVSARRLGALGVADTEVPGPPQVERATRRMQAEELLAAWDEDERRDAAARDLAAGPHTAGPDTGRAQERPGAAEVAG